MILNRHGLTAKVARSYTLIAACLLLLAGVLALSVGPGALRPVAENTPQSPFAADTSAIRASYSRLPMIFEANQGQADPSVKFVARGSGYGLFLTNRDVVLSLRPRSGKNSAVRMSLTGANRDATASATDELPGKSNYLIGNNPAKWHRNIPQFSRVRYSGVYPGIDLVYYGKQGKLEYDFEVAPSADPSQVALRFQGEEDLALSSEGDLVLSTGTGDLRFQAPHIYQQIGREQKPVEGRFVVRGKDLVGFEVGAYDRTRVLVIDPVLVYSTYFGGAGSETSPVIAVDSSSNMYIAVSTTSTEPLSTATVTPYQTAPKAGNTSTVLITKLDSGGANLIFQTYLGGTGHDTVAGIALDSGFNVLVTGSTTSTDFPAINAFQSTAVTVGTHAFVTSVDSLGKSLLYSTYLAGNGTDDAAGIAVDVRNKAYVIGRTTSTNFPTTTGAIQTTSLATNQFFVSKIDPATSGTASVPYSTYFGGGNPANGVVEGGGIAVDVNSNVYITGGTNFVHTGSNVTTDFPILNAYLGCLDSPTNPALCTTPTANPIPKDGFVAKITPTAATGAQIIYSTYIGGTGEDVAYGIALDSSSNAYVTGSTTSIDIPTVGSFPYQAVMDCSPVVTLPGQCGKTDAFLIKLSSFTPSTTSTTTTTVTPLYTSYLGGTGDDTGLAIAVDSAQGARITGTTDSPDFPLSGAVAAFGGGTDLDAFVARIDTAATVATVPNSGIPGSSYSTYLGGIGIDRGTSIAVDPLGSSFVVGDTTSGNFPLVTPRQAILNGPSDAFISKLSSIVALTMTATDTPNPAGVGNQVTFTYTITNTGDLVTGVTFRDVFTSTSGTFVSATSTPGGCSAPSGTPSTLTCAIGTLNAAATATVTVVLTPPVSTTPGTSPTSFGNTATITVAGSNFTTSATATTSVTDFSMAVSPASQTEPAGTPATYSVTVTPGGSFPDSVSLSCGAGLPTGASCEFINNPITALSSGPQSRVLTINSTARVTTTAQLDPLHAPFYALWLPISGFAFLGFGVRRKMSRRQKVLAALLLGMILTGIAVQFGCGSSSQSTTTTTGTPAGTYTVTVTASSGSASRSSAVTLVVQ